MLESAGQTAVFIILMIVLQTLGAWFLPNRWEGASGPLEIGGMSLLAGAIYCVLMGWIRREKKRD